jgi:hypothetical protein
MFPLCRFQTIYGVDFSGAKLAGHNTWVAEVLVGDNARLTLAEVRSLEAMSGFAERGPALGWLVDAIAESEGALWAIDFPFAMPIEVMAPKATWRRQLEDMGGWRKDAYAMGLRCVSRSKRHNGALHIRRLTDTEQRTPFDCYHYRIIYQTFHGMRDVLLPLSRRRGTAVLPFGYRKLGAARNVVIESCPGSVLRRLSLPYNNYKQPAGGPLTPIRRRTRHRILEAMGQWVEIPGALRNRIMRNPGGDALDAVIAAVGAALRWETLDHEGIARHRRYRLEGYVYA